MQAGQEVDKSSKVEETARFEQALTKNTMEKLNEERLRLRLENEALHLRNKDLEAQLVRALATVDAKEAIIARKDLLIEQTLTQVIDRMNSLDQSQLNNSLNETVMNASFIADRKDPKQDEIQKWLTKIGKYMSPQRVQCIAVLGDYLMRHPKENLVIENREDSEVAILFIQELVKASEETTSQCIESFKRSLQVKLKEGNKDYTPSREFERTALEMHDRRLDDTHVARKPGDDEKLLNSLHKLFDVNAFNVPELAKHFPRRLEVPAYSMFKN